MASFTNQEKGDEKSAMVQDDSWLALFWRGSKLLHLIDEEAAIKTTFGHTFCELHTLLNTFFGFPVA